MAHSVTSARLVVGRSQGTLQAQTGLGSGPRSSPVIMAEMVFSWSISEPVVPRKSPSMALGKPLEETREVSKPKRHLWCHSVVPLRSNWLQKSASRNETG